MTPSSGVNPSGGRLAAGCLFLFGFFVFLFAAGSLLVISQNLRGSILGAVVMMGMLLVFAVLGAGIMMFAWKLPGRTREQQRRRDRHPDQPWLWREDWEQGVVRAERSGSARLRLSTLPGVLGGKLEGVIDLPSLTSNDVVLTLNCISWRARGRNTTSSILWQERTEARVQAGGSGSEIPVSFELPYDLDATGRSSSNPAEQVSWWLKVRSGGRALAGFTVPAFRIPSSDPKQTREALEAREGIRLAGTGLAAAGNHYRFGGGRNRPAAFLLTLFGCVFLIGAAFLASQFDSFVSEIVGGAVVVVAGGLGLLAIGASLWLWFGVTDVLAEGDALHIRYSWLGLERSRVVPKDRIRGFAINPSLQNGKDQVWYDVFVQLADGSQANAGTGLEKADAERFIAAIAHELGVTWGGLKM
jgi:hypothetical protein